MKWQPLKWKMRNIAELWPVERFFSRSPLLYLPLQKLTSILNQPFVCVSFWFAVTIENEVEIFTINKF